MKINDAVAFLIAHKAAVDVLRPGADKILNTHTFTHS